MENKSSAIKKWFPQVIVAVAVTLMNVDLGMSSGWSSPYIAKLTIPGSPIYLDREQSSWVTSILNIGRFLGCFVGAVSVNFFGCKRTLLITLFPLSMAWGCTILADGPEWLYVGRLLGGVALGMSFSSFPLFLGEVSLPEIRGAMVSLALCGGTVGVLVASIIGSKFDMDVTGTIAVVPCFILMLVFFWLPESPHHLLKYDRTEEARDSVNFYRGGYKVDEEMKALMQFVSNAKSQSFSSKLRLFQERYLMRATLLVIILQVYYQMSGFNCVIFYMESILIRANVSVVQPSTVVNFISATGVCASIMSALLIDRFGRRCLLVISGIGVTMAMTGLGTHFSLIKMDYPVTEELQWLPVVSLFLFDLAFYFGLMSVPNTVMSEIFPTNVKCIAACIASMTGAFFAFVATKSYEPLNSWIGENMVFYIYAGITITVIPFALLFMPETKGKTLQQVQDKLVRR